VTALGYGLTRGFSAAYGQRGAEVVSPWGATAATSGRMFLRAGEQDLDSVHSGGGGGGGGGNADELRGYVASRGAATNFGFLESRIFPPPQPPMTDGEEAAAAAYQAGDLLRTSTRPTRRCVPTNRIRASV